MRVGQPVGEAVAALPDHGEGGEPVADLARPGRLGCRSPVIATTRCVHRGRGHRVERVQQGGGGDVGGGPLPQRGGQSRLGQPGHRRLGHHEHGDRYRFRARRHEMTFQKSTAAVKLPRTDPLTFDFPPVRGP